MSLIILVVGGLSTRIICPSLHLRDISLGYSSRVLVSFLLCLRFGFLLPLCIGLICLMPSLLFCMMFALKPWGKIRECVDLIATSLRVLQFWPSYCTALFCLRNGSSNYLVFSQSEELTSPILKANYRFREIERDRPIKNSYQFNL